MNYVLGTLTTEDLSRLRPVEIRRQAVRLNPRAYSAAEIEMAEMAYYRMLAEMVETYGIDDSRKWSISLFTGTIISGTEIFDE
jgi:hypothetical protein